MHNDEAVSFIQAMVSDPEAYPDRVVGIVLGSILDERLAQFVKSRLHSHKKALDDAFRETGILRTFASRITTALLIGAISLETRDDLIRVKGVRNASAHKIGAHTFDTQPACDHIDGLTCLDKHLVFNTPEVIWDFGKPEDFPLHDRRARFIRAVQLLNGMLFLGISMFSKDPKPTPRF
ncbi:MAG: hypothetical protein ABI626_10335 [Sphingomicrobium sp.]